MANIVNGDTVIWTEGVFHGGSFSRWGNRPGKYLGDREVEGVIVSSRYGDATTAHWLTVLVSASSGVEPIAPGTKLRRKAATVYGGLTHHEDGAEHVEQEAVKRAQKMRAAERTGNPIRASNLRDQAGFVPFGQSQGAKIGDHVCHPIFGAGEVVGLAEAGRVARVRFAHGESSLDLIYAQLTILAAI